MSDFPDAKCPHCNDPLIPGVYEAKPAEHRIGLYWSTNATTRECKAVLLDQGYFDIQSTSPRLPIYRCGGCDERVPYDLLLPYLQELLP